MPKISSIFLSRLTKYVNAGYICVGNSTKISSLIPTAKNGYAICTAVFHKLLFHNRLNGQQRL